MPLTKKQQEAIDEENRQFMEEFIFFLTVNSLLTYTEADLGAYKTANEKTIVDWKAATIEGRTEMLPPTEPPELVNDPDPPASLILKPDLMLINDRAVEYSKAYGQELQEKGGTVIDGEFKPWLKDMGEEDRKTVTEIITRGIEEGKATGVIESESGTYPKGSVAAELQDYFGERKSHAAMVARTETARIMNTANANRFAELGYDKVQIWDNEGPNSCEECKIAHGQIWSLSYYRQNPLQHPNCVRTANPIKTDQTPDRE